MPRIELPSMVTETMALGGSIDHVKADSISEG